MEESEPLLEFAGVSALLDDERYHDVEQVSFTLDAGKVAAVRLEGDRYSPLPALAIGDWPPDADLKEPISGEVKFESIAWQQRSVHDQMACRGRIGIVLALGGWVNNLNVLENVLLRVMHHTRRPRREIATEAQQLAYTAGLSEIPPRRMSTLSRSELKRCEWVRAFLGSPRLVILERPCRSVLRPDWDSLASLVRDAAARRAGVLWLAGEPGEFDFAAAFADNRYVMNAAKLLPEGDGR